MTTHWCPTLAAHHGPAYKAIADALAADIEAGRLKAGDRLPTHRDLADRLNLTVTTITRAYVEARRRGLVDGEVGRGTFVRGQETARAAMDPRYSIDIPPSPQADGAPIDFRLNLIPATTQGEHLAATLAHLSRNNAPLMEELMEYQPDAGLRRHREAGAVWLNRLGLGRERGLGRGLGPGLGPEVEADNVVITAGSQHGLSITLNALLGPGDSLLSDPLTYPGLSGHARAQGLALHGVTGDREGMCPDALEAVCRRSGAVPKALYLVPTLHNPTTITLSAQRRRDLVAVADRHGLLVIEDDIFGALLTEAERPPALASLYPQRTIFLSGSKLPAPGLRVGYIAAPPALAARLAAAVRLDLWMIPPLMAEISSRWIEDGTTETLIAQTRTELMHRRTLAERLLQPAGPGVITPCLRQSPHLWCTLPAPWKMDSFIARAEQEGVRLQGPDVFAIARGAIPPRSFRLCLGLERCAKRLEIGLRRLAALLEDGPQASSPLEETIHGEVMV